MTAVHVIVGSGQAGDWAAAAMRQAGFAGRILLIGEEPWLPYERPPLSKRVLTDETEPTPQYFRDAGLYAERGIEVRLQTRVAGIDVAAGRVHLETGDMVAFDKLLIATGGAPRRLAMPGAEHALVLRTWDDARRMRDAIATARRLVCVGAGVIGLEVAASAATMGRQVTVIEAGPAPMGRSLAPECRGYILGLHAAAGVELRFGTTVDEIVALPGGGKCVVCSDGRTINCDVVVAAIGIERNDALAREAGIATDNGILVDEFGRTDSENV
jgi:NADPH-dependent 2,4-dienoyl-CoA reductase/sulfur reductase-like enzyme